MWQAIIANNFKCISHALVNIFISGSAIYLHLLTEQVMLFVCISYKFLPNYATLAKNMTEASANMFDRVCNNYVFTSLLESNVTVVNIEIQ